MAIPVNIKSKMLLTLYRFIEKNVVSHHNQSAKRDLIDASGKKRPPQYIISVANHLANDTDITTETFNAVQAKYTLRSYLT